VTEHGPTGAAPAGGWHDATVADVAHPSAHGVRLRLDVDDRVRHLPGQHYVVRLVAPDGYVAQRSYSIASDPSDPLVELYVERLADGEVSPFLADDVVVGDGLTLRGPIGGWFVWNGDRPILGVGGGSGVVPLVAMQRHAAALGRPDLVRLAVAARSIDDLPYATELLGAGAFVALSRATRPGDGRPAGRLSVGELAPLVAGRRRCYVCGSHAFAEGVSQMLVGIGVPPGEIRIERFGPSG
jgi:ferredoxin-NADP reductase